MRLSRRLLFTSALLVSVSPALAQAPAGGLKRGFEATAPAVASAEEIEQGDLWVMQVDFKPMRLVRIESKDPETGAKRTELVWYLVYRAVNRPLKSPPAEAGKTPVNNYDPEPGPAMFIPEFTLVTDDNNVQQVYPDTVIPEAAEAIARREVRGGARDPLKNSVEVVQPITPAEDKNAKPIYGVATWRGIDPTTDHFRAYASGFSNGYKEGKGPDGKPLILRREVVLDFYRPGDEFDPTEREFRLQGQPRWIYRAENAVATDAGEEAIPTEQVKASAK